MSAALILPVYAKEEEDSSFSTIHTPLDARLTSHTKFRAQSDRSTVLHGSFIVLVYDAPHVAAVIQDHQLLRRPLHIYQRVLTGFAVDSLEERTLEALLNDARVELVAEDGRLDEDEEQAPSTAPFPHPLLPPLIATQSAAPWHLDRLDGAGGGDLLYHYPAHAAVHIDVFLLDSGLRATHTEFFSGSSLPSRVHVPCFADVGPCHTDTNGHGTHVASIVGGVQYGVAKAVTLHDVRIRDAANVLRWAYLYAGWDYVVEQAQLYPNRTMIANVSYSGSSFEVADRAAQQVLDAGVIMIAAAGNQAADACDRSPARVPGVVAVGSMAVGDVRAASSNTGPCLTLWAPGSDIAAAGMDSDTAVTVKSGTSMAAPVVAGVMALYLAEGWTLDDLLADAEVVESLADPVTTGKLVSVQRLLQQQGSSSPAPTTTSPSAAPGTPSPSQETWS